VTDKKVNVAVVGATGEVGQAMLSILEQRDFPVAGLHVVASSRSAGKTIEFRDEELVVEDLEEAARLYEHALGLRAGDRAYRRPGATSRRYRLGSFRLELHQPDGPGLVAAELERRGPGPYRLVLATSDLDLTADTLSRAGVTISRSSTGLDIAPSEAVGARIRIVPA